MLNDLQVIYFRITALKSGSPGNVCHVCYVTQSTGNFLVYRYFMPCIKMVHKEI